MPQAVNQIYNVAVGERTSLNRLYEMMRALLSEKFPGLHAHKPSYADFRKGDVLHSQADISKAGEMLGYDPTHRIDEGLKQAMGWYTAYLTSGKEELTAGRR
jgi:UDP-N-acetylglucosamine 4-epimerase